MINFEHVRLSSWSNTVFYNDAWHSNIWEDSGIDVYEFAERMKKVMDPDDVSDGYRFSNIEDSIRYNINYGISKELLHDILDFFKYKKIIDG